MNCRMCGSALPSDAVYCPRCGVRVVEGSGAENAPPSPPSSGAAPAPTAGAPPAPGPTETVAEALRNRAGAANDLGEQPLWEGRFSPKAMLGDAVLTGLGTVAMLAFAIYINTATIWWIAVGLIALAWVVLGSRMAYRVWSIRYKLTSQRFFHQAGILSRVTDRIDVIDMDDITFMQGIVDRLVGVGNIKIKSSDVTHPEIWLRGVEDVARVADLIDRARREERRKRGVHIETI